MSPVAALDEQTPQFPEAGRIRLGITKVSEKTGKSFPSATPTLVYTSPHRQHLEALAECYGGEIEQYVPQQETEPKWRLVSESDAAKVRLPFPNAIEAIDQWKELYGSGFIVRRCNGRDACTTYRVMEDHVEPEDTDCICRMQGEEECSTVTRLRLLLPDSGIMGVWLLTTRAKTAARGLNGMIRGIAEGDWGGQANRVPLRLVYEPVKIPYVAKGKRTTTTKRVPRLYIDATYEEAARLAAGVGPVAELEGSVGAGPDADGSEGSTPSSRQGGLPAPTEHRSGTVATGTAAGDRRATGSIPAGASVAVPEHRSEVSDRGSSTVGNGGEALDAEPPSSESTSGEEGHAEPVHGQTDLADSSPERPHRFVGEDPDGPCEVEGCGFMMEAEVHGGPSSLFSHGGQS